MGFCELDTTRKRILDSLIARKLASPDEILERLTIGDSEDDVRPFVMGLYQGRPPEDDGAIDCLSGQVLDLLFQKCRRSNDRSEDAIQICERMIEAFPEEPSPYVHLAACLSDSERWADVCDVCMRAEGKFGEEILKDTCRMLGLAGYRAKPRDTFTDGESPAVPLPADDHIDAALLMAWEQERNDTEIVKALAIRFSDKSDGSADAMAVYEECHELGVVVPAALRLLAEHILQNSTDEAATEKAIALYTQISEYGGEDAKSAAVPLCELWVQAERFEGISVKAINVAYEQSPSKPAVQRCLQELLSNSRTLDIQALRLARSFVEDVEDLPEIRDRICATLQAWPDWHEEQIELAHWLLSTGTSDTDLKARFVRAAGQRLWDETVSCSLSQPLANEGNPTDDHN